ncbi:TIGR00341 family protein [Halobacteriales archaeon QS_1_68_17]|nr:MAG: TIGR00341 family protein [Halobacteriales archaeon QS_1_68_17]
MRLVQLTIPAGKRSVILETLDDEDVDYVVTDETTGREYTGVAYFPLPTNAVEPVLDKLREAGVEEDAYTVIIDAEAVISSRFDKLQERYAEENESADRIARQELRAKAVEMAPSGRVFVVMTAISAMVATAGLLLDSPAVVVGSMVIAPLIGPAIETSVGSVIDDAELFLRGVKFQLLGGLVAVVGATIFAVAVRTLLLVPPGMDILELTQVSSRLSPDFLSLVIALGAGVAGALTLSTGVSTALVGVMIAAALVPPVGVIGIGIAWERPTVVVNAAVLVLVNILSINLAALATLWYTGYRPESIFKRPETRMEVGRRMAVLVAAIVFLSVFLGGVTLTSIQGATFEQRVNQEVGTLLESPEYEGLALLDLTIERSSSLPLREQRTNITVTVGRPRTTEYPDLAERIKQRAAAETDQPVSVQVRFVEVDTA